MKKNMIIVFVAILAFASLVGLVLKTGFLVPGLLFQRGSVDTKALAERHKVLDLDKAEVYDSVAFLPKSARFSQDNDMPKGEMLYRDVTKNVDQFAKDHKLEITSISIVSESYESSFGSSGTNWHGVWITFSHRK